MKKRKMNLVACVVVLFLGVAVSSLPVSQPVYPTTQYISAQQVQQPLQLQALRQPHIQYSQPQYISTGQSPIYQQPLPARTPPPPPPPPQNPPAGITQLLLPTAADRQVQKAAQNLAGPGYAQQVQALQLQGLAAQAQLAAQRRAQVTAQRQIQQYRQFAPQPQYLQEITQAQGVKPQLQIASLRSQPAPLAPANNAETEEDYDHNPSYQFGFDVKDDYYTNYQNRKEQRDGDKISGSYSVVDADGFLRTVSYTADPKEGFKAEVNRQPTDIVVKVPKPVIPQLKQQQQQQQYIQEVPVDGAQLQGQKPRYVYQYQ